MKRKFCGIILSIARGSRCMAGASYGAIHTDLPFRRRIIHVYTCRCKWWKSVHSASCDEADSPPQNTGATAPQVGHGT